MADSSLTPLSKKRRNKTLVVPEDVILYKILPHLPVKSALRFQLVSKTWRHLINLPFVTRLHHSLAKALNPTTFLITSFKANPIHVDMISVDRNTKKIKPLDIDCMHLHEAVKDVGSASIYGRMVGICAGVVCLVYDDFAVIWNPAIREVHVVKYLFSMFEYLNWIDFDEIILTCMGFGDVKDGDGNVVDFKLFFVARKLADGRIFSLYSLKTDKWSIVEFPSFDIKYLRSDNFVCLSGVLHGIAWENNTESSAFVLTFDLASNTFGRIEFPQEIELVIGYDNFLTVLEGRYLALVVTTEGAEAMGINIWILKDDCIWRVAEKMSGPLGIRGCTLLGYWEDGNAVIAHNLNTLSFLSKEKSTAYETPLPIPMKCLEYAESFVSPKRISDQTNI